MHGRATAIIFVLVLLSDAVIASQSSEDEDDSSHSDDDDVDDDDDDVVSPAKCREHIPHTTAPRLTTDISCTESDRSMNCPPGVDRPVVMAVSLDGFRAEYLSRNVTPTLQALRDCGIRAPYMKAVFPTKTFPNHYSIATGLYSESHGIVSNEFYDPEFGEIFKYGGRNNSDNRWWYGEPIWNTAKKAGKKVATLMLVGSDVNIQDMRPDICYTYNGSVTMDDRVAEVLTWFDSDPKDFPDLGLLYFEEPDGLGHAVGPLDSRMDEMLANVDSLIATLIEGLKRRLNNCFDIIIVSDHGMTPVKVPDRVIGLSEYIDVSQYTVYGGGHVRLSSHYRVNSHTNVTANDNPVPVAVTLSQLGCGSVSSSEDLRVHMRAMVKQDLPKRYHFSNSRRIEDIVVDIDDEFAAVRFVPPVSLTFGQHGHDNAYQSMHGIFIAYGPSFKQNTVVDGFENIELYNLVAELLDVPRAPNNGTEGSLHHLLTCPTTLPPRSNGTDYSTAQYPATDCVYETIVNAADTGCDCSKFKIVRYVRRGSTSRHNAHRIIATKFTVAHQARGRRRKAHTPRRSLPIKRRQTDDRPQRTNMPSGHLCTRCTTNAFGREQIKLFDSRLNLTKNQQRALEAYHLTHGLPVYRSTVPAYLLHHTSFVSVYSEQLRQPMWTAAHINEIRTLSPSVDCSRVDVRLSANQQPTCHDYSSNDHIAKAYLFPPQWSSDISESSEAELLTNVVPMSTRFKTDIWDYTLDYIRDVSLKFADQELYVIFGPVFDYDADGLADDDLTAARLAGNISGIPVASHFFVILLKCRTPTSCSQHDYDNLVFILPQWQAHASSSCLTPAETLRFNTARIRDVELLTGLEFLRNHPSAQAAVRIRVSATDMLW